MDALQLFPHNLPALLQKPVAVLSGLSCVAGITTGHHQDSTVLQISLNGNKTASYTQALQCLNVKGISPRYLNINPAQGYIKIKLSITQA